MNTESTSWAAARPTQKEEQCQYSRAWSFVALDIGTVLLSAAVGATSMRRYQPFLILSTPLKSVETLKFISKPRGLFVCRR